MFDIVMAYYGIYIPIEKCSLSSEDGKFHTVFSFHGLFRLRDIRGER